MGNENLSQFRTGVRCAAWNVLAEGYLHLDRYPHLGGRRPAARSDRVVERSVRLASTLDVLGLVECEEDVAAGVGRALGTGWTTHWERRPGSRPDGSFVAARTATGAVPGGWTGRAGDLAAATVSLRSGLSITFAHLSWAPRHTRDHPAEDQVDELVAAVSSPSVIAGDFNSSPGGDVERMFRDHGWDVSYPRLPTAHFGHGTEIIDGVAALGASVDSVVVDGDGERPLPRLPAEPSDHLPILFRVMTGGGWTAGSQGVEDNGTHWTGRGEGGLWRVFR